MSSLIQVEVASLQRTFRVNEAALRSLLTGRDGPVARDLSRRALRVESAAKRNATDRPGPRVKTGRLRGSITWRLGSDGRGLYADVGTAVHYAPFVEMGTSRAPAYPYLRPALESARG